MDSNVNDLLLKHSALVDGIRKSVTDTNNWSGFICDYIVTVLIIRGQMNI